MGVTNFLNSRTQIIKSKMYTYLHKLLKFHTLAVFVCLVTDSKVLGLCVYSLSFSVIVASKYRLDLL